MLRASRSRIPLRLIVALLAPAGSVASAQSILTGEGERCPQGIAPFATPFCAELVATPDLTGVQGMLELKWIATPFGVAVRPDGQLRHRLVARFSGLPDPRALGPYAAYIAWGYDLTHRREIKLGAKCLSPYINII